MRFLGFFIQGECLIWALLFRVCIVSKKKKKQQNGLGFHLCLQGRQILLQWDMFKIPHQLNLIAVFESGQSSFPYPIYFSPRELTDLICCVRYAISYFHQSSSKPPMETVTEFLFSGSKITADGDSSHGIKSYLLLGRKAVTNLSIILKAETVLCPQRSVQSKLWFFQQSCMGVRVGP